MWAFCQHTCCSPTPPWTSCLRAYLTSGAVPGAAPLATPGPGPNGSVSAPPGKPCPGWAPPHALGLVLPCRLPCTLTQPWNPAWVHRAVVPDGFSFECGQKIYTGAVITYSASEKERTWAVTVGFSPR